jgi:hypothetical protein
VRRVILILAALVLLGTVQPASATHDWGSPPYHWERSSNPFTVTLIDNTTYDQEMALGAADWSKSSVLDMVVGGSKRGRGGSLRVNVTNGESSSGNAAWAYLYLDADNHITGATVQLNDTVLRTRDPSYALFAMCHELGHALGLDHNFTGDGSCVGGFGTGNLHPSAHDYEQLEILYSHLDR